MVTLAGISGKRDRMDLNKLNGIIDRLVMVRDDIEFADQDLGFLVEVQHQDKRGNDSREFLKLKGIDVFDKQVFFIVYSGSGFVEKV